jgi:hypothetical protein
MENIIEELIGQVKRVEIRAGRTVVFNARMGRASSGIA